MSYPHDRWYLWLQCINYLIISFIFHCVGHVHEFKALFGYSSVKETNKQYTLWSCVFLPFISLNRLKSYQDQTHERLKNWNTHFSLFSLWFWLRPLQMQIFFCLLTIPLLCITFICLNPQPCADFLTKEHSGALSTLHTPTT